MAPISHLRYWDWDGLTGGGIVNIISYWPASQRTCRYDARICLGETRTNTLNRFDLCYSFKMLCRAEYGGTHQLHIAAKNYALNLGTLQSSCFLTLCTSPSGRAGDASMAPPSNTRHTYQCLPATYSFGSTETLGSPQSTHTDMDTTMEMGGLSVAPGGPDLCHMTLRASIPLAAQGTMSTRTWPPLLPKGLRPPQRRFWKDSPGLRR